MVYNTVLTAEKQGPQVAGAQIAGVYCIHPGCADVHVKPREPDLERGKLNLLKPPKFIGKVV